MLDNFKDMELGDEMVSGVTGGAMANVATLRYTDEIYADAGISVSRKGGNNHYHGAGRVFCHGRQPEQFVGQP